jgi:hypothetical protein
MQMAIKYSDLDLGRIEAIANKLGGMDGIGRFLDNGFILVDPTKAKRGVKAPEPLFTFSGTFKTQGAKEFIAKQKFVIDTSENARVRISYLGDNFRKHLLQKVERDIVAGNLKLSKLNRLQHDLPMSDEEPGTVAGLGGLTKAEITLCEFYETLAHKQAIGDFSWTVGYVRDDNDVLWAVDARWFGDGWDVGADSVTDPGSWYAGGEFVSR